MDAFGNAFVIGETSSLSFPLVGGLGAGQQGTGTRILLTGFDPFGNVKFSTTLGGTDGSDNGTDIRVDDLGRPCIVGYTDSTDFPTVSPEQAANQGSDSAVIACLNRAADTLFFSTYLGGTSGERGSALALDASGNVYVTGDTHIQQHSDL